MLSSPDRLTTGSEYSVWTGHREASDCQWTGVNRQKLCNRYSEQHEDDCQNALQGCVIDQIQTAMDKVLQAHTVTVQCYKSAQTETDTAYNSLNDDVAFGLCRNGRIVAMESLNPLLFCLLHVKPNLHFSTENWLSNLQLWNMSSGRGYAQYWLLVVASQIWWLPFHV